MLIDDIMETYTAAIKKGKTPPMKSVVGAQMVAGISAWKFAIKFRADNVNDFVTNVLNDMVATGKKWGGNEFFSIMPPYPLMWIEWKEGEKGGFQQRGATVLSYTRDEFHATKSIPTNVKANLRDLENQRGLPKLYCVCKFWSKPPGHDIGIVDGMLFSINEDGSLGLGSATIRNPLTTKAISPEEEQELTADLADNYLVPVLYTLQFCNVKNIVEKSFNQPEKLNKAREKRGKLPLVSFKTLEIQPIRKTIENTKHEKNVSGKVALHFCRGHFKDYREHGLFGKNKGVYWWDAQARGHEDAGAVIKDYKVKTGMISP